MGEQGIKSDIQPFKMYGNLYFVGSSKVSVHLIETEEGLIMIDTGYPEMYEQICDSMEELGFHPEDICAIIHSHGHIDHFGCTARFQERSGAKTYISRIDNNILNGTDDLSWARELGYEPLQPFDCDVLIEDGDSVTFGNTTVRFRLAPGHTAGTLAIFVDVEADGEHKIAAMHGGIGLNSMTAKFLQSYQLPLDCRDRFREGLHALSKEHVDLVMGNHAGQNDTPGKLEKVLAGENILDPGEWQRFLLNVEEKLDAMLKREMAEV